MGQTVQKIEPTRDQGCCGAGKSVIPDLQGRFEAQAGPQWVICSARTLFVPGFAQRFQQSIALFQSTIEVRNDSGIAGSECNQQLIEIGAALSGFALDQTEVLRGEHDRRQQT